MKTLITISISVLIMCLALDAYGYYKDKSELSQLPQKEVHIAIIDRKGYSVYVKTVITPKSEIIAYKGNIYVKYKNIKKKIGKGVGYKVLLIKDI